MTPPATFQWPLSPCGTFQPARFLPLKSGVKPSGGLSSAARSEKLPAASRHATARAIQRVRGMERPPWRWGELSSRLDAGEYHGEYNEMIRRTSCQLVISAGQAVSLPYDSASARYSRPR